MADRDQYAFLRNFPTGDVAVFQHTPNLQILRVSYTGVSGDIVVLGGLKNLTSVDFRDCQVVVGDVAVFEHTPNLKELTAYGTKISGDVGVFKHTPNLTTLYVNGTGVSGDKSAIKKVLPKCEFYF